MSRFKLLSMLDEDFNMRNLWRIVRYCYNIPQENYDNEISVVHVAIERLANVRDGQAVDVDLALTQDMLIRDLSKRTLKGNKGAARELERFTKNLKII